MFQRTLLTASRRLAVAPRATFAARRTFVSSVVRASDNTSVKSESAKNLKSFHEIKTEADLIGPGAAPGTVPSDIDQATGLERLEILGKIDGVDIFDMRPLDASRKGTLTDPITVQSYGEEQYLGCTGVPVDSHITIWLTVSKDRPIERCPECGSVYKMDYVGPDTDAHAHDDHGHGDHGDHGHPASYKEPATMADFVKPQYW